MLKSVKRLYLSGNSTADLLFTSFLISFSSSAIVLSALTVFNAIFTSIVFAMSAASFSISLLYFKKRHFPISWISRLKLICGAFLTLLMLHMIL